MFFGSRLFFRFSDPRDPPRGPPGDPPGVPGPPPGPPGTPPATITIVTRCHPESESRVMRPFWVLIKFYKSRFWTPPGAPPRGPGGRPRPPPAPPRGPPPALGFCPPPPHQHPPRLPAAMCRAPGGGGAAGPGAAPGGARGAPRGARGGRPGGSKTDFYKIV
jgi:hypothetical protein